MIPEFQQRHIFELPENCGLITMIKTAPVTYNIYHEQMNDTHTIKIRSVGTGTISDCLLI